MATKTANRYNNSFFLVITIIYKVVYEQHGAYQDKRDDDGGT